MNSCPHSRHVKIESPRFALKLTAAQIPQASSPEPPSPSPSHVQSFTKCLLHIFYLVTALWGSKIRVPEKKLFFTFIFLTCLVCFQIYSDHICNSDILFYSVFSLHIVNHLWNSSTTLICSSIFYLKNEKIMIKIQFIPFVLWVGELYGFLFFFFFLLSALLRKAKLSWFEMLKMYETKNISDSTCD